MPASQLKGSRPVSLDEMSKHAEDQLLSEFPQYKEKIATLLRNRFLPQASKSASAPVTVAQPRIEKIELPQEELLTIIQKLHEVVQLPTAKLDQETELYLEQQLSDILGFEVSSTLDGHMLQFSKGIIDSLPHLPSNPQEKDLKPGIISEAPLQGQRSYYGWYGLSYTGETDSIITPYWVAVPAHSITPSENDWPFKKKLLLVNATNGICVVANILDNYLDVTNKHQLGASPAVIRQGLFWSPQNVGKCLCFFVPDRGNVIKPGVYQLISQ